MEIDTSRIRLLFIIFGILTVIGLIITLTNDFLDLYYFNTFSKIYIRSDFHEMLLDLNGILTMIWMDGALISGITYRYKKSKDSGEEFHLIYFLLQVITIIILTFSLISYLFV